MLSIIQSLGLGGIEPFRVTVEASVTKAMPVFEIVGLPDTAVRESRERVRSVFQSRGYPFPDGRIVVNLAPAAVRKAGALYDLPILVGLLCAQGVLPPVPPTDMLLGELSLSGEVRPASGVLPMLLGAAALGLRRAFVPYENAAEASMAKDLLVYAVRNVEELVRFMRGEGSLPTAGSLPQSDPPDIPAPDFSEVKGQAVAKRAMEIAAAGGHNILLIGSPGAGKSMLAKRMPSILPEMTLEEAIETTKVYSASGLLPPGTPLIRHRPFRAPHHSISLGGLCGGGSIPHPGEISLAHNGVLFLDELPEFPRDRLEALRQPLEDGKLTIARVNFQYTFPSRITLVAAMNPCPCGYFGHPTRQCRCSQNKVALYLGKISSPLLDRLDLHVEAMPVEFSQLSSDKREETSETIRARVCAAREIQNRRFSGTGIPCNASITPALLSEFCGLSGESQRFLADVFQKLSLSARAYDRILKVSRTIADLEGSENIELAHLSEAVQYRSLDRKYWNN